MARAVFGETPPPREWQPGDTYPGAGQLGGLPLAVLCTDPTATRARQRTADALAPGLNVSACYRCLAYRPATPTGCHFTERMDR